MVIVQFFEGLSEGEDEAPSKKAPKRDSLPPFVYSPKERLFNLTPPFKPVNMKEVYLPHSTVPRNAMTVRSHWNSGSEQFINYMNKQFIPFQAQHTNDSNPIVTWNEELQTLQVRYTTSTKHSFSQSFTNARLSSSHPVCFSPSPSLFSLHNHADTLIYFVLFFSGVR